MKNIANAAFITEFCRTTTNMYRLGWDERNGGNVSMLLDEKLVKEYLDVNKVIKTYDLDFFVDEIMANRYILITGTGKYFKNVEYAPDVNLGIVRITSDCKKAELLWGFSDGGRYTSEFPAHLMSHAQRLKVDPNHTVVMHCHPTNLLAMTFIHSLDEKEFTRSLWRMITECMVVFPDGIAVLPWMLCGTNEIGVATSQKMKEFRLVVWAQHGLYGTGKDLDEAFGLIETVEKAAEIYMKICDKPIVNTITDEQLKIIAEGFNVKYREGWLD